MGNMLPAHTASGISTACESVWPSVHRTDNCVFVAVPFRLDTTEQRQLIFVPLLGCVGNTTQHERLVSALPTNLRVCVLLWVWVMVRVFLGIAGTLFRISVLLCVSLVAPGLGFTESCPA